MLELLYGAQGSAFVHKIMEDEPLAVGLLEKTSHSLQDKSDEVDEPVAAAEAPIDFDKIDGSLDGLSVCIFKRRRNYLYLMSVFFSFIRRTMMFLK